MPKGLSQAVKDNLEKCRASAVAAVEVYNRPGPRFRTAHFVVLIVMSWTALFHAIFYRRGNKPWYKKPGKHPKGDRFLKIDGEPKHWDLSECVKQYFAANTPPERKNIEFLIGLRNKIEHRHIPELDPGLYGECQATLLNLEALISGEFGAHYALVEQLAVSLQFSGLVPSQKKDAAKRLASKAAKSVKEYVEKFRAGLPSSTLNNTKYSFNVFLVPKVANRRDLADVAVEFIKVDETNREELERLEKLNVLIKEKHIPIANLDLYKPSEVVKQVQAVIPHKLNVSGHTEAWKHFNIRPKFGAPNPQVTDGRYCVYDAVHKDYAYTRAWVEKLKVDLMQVESFVWITRAPAIPK